MASRFGRPFREVILEAYEDFAVLLALVHPESHVKFEAAAVFVRRQGLSLRDPLARWLQDQLRALASRGLGDLQAQHEHLIERTQVVNAAVLAADRIEEEPRFIRLGQSWILGEDGKCVSLRPGDLDPGLFKRWLWQEVKKDFAAFVKGERSIAAEKAPDVKAGDLGDNPEIARIPRAARASEIARRESPPTPLEELEAVDAARERKELLGAIECGLSSRLHELFELLKEDPDREDLPTLLHVPDATVRVMRYRLRRQALRARGPGS